MYDFELSTSVPIFRPDDQKLDLPTVGGRARTAATMFGVLTSTRQVLLPFVPTLGMRIDVGSDDRVGLVKEFVRAAEERGIDSRLVGLLPADCWFPSRVVSSVKYHLADGQFTIGFQEPPEGLHYATDERIATSLMQHLCDWAPTFGWSTEYVLAEPVLGH